MYKVILTCVLLTGCAHIPNRSGGCPDEFPVKGNMDSFIYHMPDSPYYFKTGAEWCFKTEKAAKAMGYRPSKAK